MTLPEIIEASDKWIASEEIQLAIQSSPTPGELEDCFRYAFLAGINAAKAHSNKSKWPDSAAEADRQHMHELGVAWP